MKKVFLLVAVLCGVFTTTIKAQEMVASEIEIVEGEAVKEPIKIEWQSSFKEALSKAKSEKKPILIYFTGSDWCGPCKTLKSKLFDTEKFKDFSDKKMVLYKADFPKNKDLVAPDNRVINEQLSSRYAQSSFPTMIVINDKGEVLGRKNGIYMTEYYFPFFEEITRSYK